MKEYVERPTQGDVQSRFFLAGRPCTHSPTTPQSSLLYGQHSLQPCKLNPSPRFSSPHFPSLPSEQHSAVQCLLSPNRIQPSSYQSIPQSLDPVLRLRRNSVLESSLEVFSQSQSLFPTIKMASSQPWLEKQKPIPLTIHCISSTEEESNQQGKQLNYFSSCKLCVLFSSPPPSPCSTVPHASTLNLGLSSIYINYSNQTWVQEAILKSTN